MAQLIARRHPGIPATDLPFNKAELVDLQFTVAAEKDWRTTDGSEIDIQLIQFTGQAAVATFRKDTYVSMLRDKTRFSNTAIDDFDPVTHPSLDAYGTRYESGPDAHGIETALFIAQGENVAIMIYVRAKAFNRATELTLFGLQQDAVGHN